MVHQDIKLVCNNKIYRESIGNAIKLMGLLSDVIVSSHIATTSDIAKSKIISKDKLFMYLRCSCYVCLYLLLKFKLSF